MQRIHFAFSSYSSFTSLSWSVRYTYPCVFNWRNIKQQEATKSRKKTRRNATTNNRSNKRNKGQVHHTLAAAFVGVGQILFLKMHGMHGLTYLFSFRTHHHRKGCRLPPWLPECRKVPPLFHEPRNVQRKKLCEVKHLHELPAPR